MESIDYWRLCDQLSIIQAALLTVNEDPSNIYTFVENWNPEEKPIGYEAAKIAITNALKNEEIDGQYIPEYDCDQNGIVNGPIENSLDLNQSQVKVDSLKEWLLKRGLNTGFFFPNLQEELDFLDSDHPRYAPKLAASVNAWLGMENKDLLKGKTPKQALDKWLRLNASEFNLSDEDGKPNEQGIQECAKVANWQDKGGAPKTLG